MLAVQNLSIWLLGPLLALVLVVVHEVGRLVRWMVRRRRPGHDAADGKE